MSVVINLGDNDYIGVLKAAAATSVGLFVKPDFAAGTAAATASTAEGDASGVLLVCNVNTAIDEQGVDDAALTVGSGEYLRLKSLKVGNIITTDKFNGTYGSINVNDKFAPGAAGLADAIAARTPALVLKVIEKTTLFGNSALKFIVEKA